MDVVIGAALLAVGIVIAALAATRTRPARPPHSAGRAGPDRPDGGDGRAGSPGSPVGVGRAVGSAGADGRERGAREPGGQAGEAVGAAERDGHAAGRQAELDRREAELVRREEDLVRRERALAAGGERLRAETEAMAERRTELERRLERASGLTAGQARQILLKEVEDAARHDGARIVRQIEEETKQDAARRVRSILSVAMQRLAAGHAAETTVSVVELPNDGMKGRIIGKEGRNIRALETLTGVDVIIDDTPNAVVLSAFDGVRRELARMTLERLLADGRIHPARIEETYYQAKTDLDRHLHEAGETAVLEAGVHGLDPELVSYLGRLKFRTSYGQNVLAHSVECANLAAMIADELGASAKTARRAALLHDIGKAASHEIEGPHALVGGQIARRHGESEAVAHAMEAHHNEVDPQTVEAVIVQTADALSGARPGARGESLESYVKRLRELEQIATRHEGVDTVYAMQAGREIRVIVAPGAIDDDGAVGLSRTIAREIEQQLEYPGQIKVTVIRESRAVDYAK